MPRGKHWTIEGLLSMGKRVGTCLEWQGRIGIRGYGAVTLWGHETSASRAAWILTNGPVPVGMLVCHTCDNRKCIEPSHLFLGTPADNSHDMAVKGRARGFGTPGNPSPSLRFTDEEVREIRRLHGEGMSNHELGRLFDATPITMSRIVRRLRRASVL